MTRIQRALKSDQKAMPDVSTLDPAPAVRGRTPELEVALGAQIRAVRLASGMSQTDLGAIVGISFQQLQKYESGKDRVAASTLQIIAVALGVPPSSFYHDEILVPTGRLPEVRLAMRVAADWQRIRNPEARERVAVLIATMAGEPTQFHPNGGL